MSKKIKWGVLGGGGDSLIGVLHRVAASMYDAYQLTGGVFNVVHEESIKFAEEIGIPTDRIYADLDAMIAAESKLPQDERIQVVSVLTPNFLHFPMAKQLLENGFNVICEKPMTMTYAEAQELGEVQKMSNRVFALTHTYTGYPMIRQMKKMITDGVIGDIQKIDAQYYQGWINPIIHDPELRKTTWRLNPEKSGISCCMGDIGVHAYQMIEYVTGMKVKSILADLNHLYEDNQMDIDGTVLLRMDTFTKGVLRASQIATAEENNLDALKLTCYINLSLVFQHQEDYQKAIDYQTKALALSIQENWIANIGGSYINLGINYDAIGENQKALNNYYKALAFSNKVNNPRLAATANYSLGDLYNEIEMYDSAIFFLDQAIITSQEIGDKLVKAQSLNSKVRSSRNSDPSNVCTTICRECLGTWPIE